MSGTVDEHAENAEHAERARVSITEGWPFHLVVAAAVSVAALVAGRRTWWFADDWNSLAMYSDGSLFQPFNGHLTLIPAAVMRSMYVVIGVGDYLPYKVMALVAITLMALAVGRFAERRIGVVGGVLVVAATLWSAAAASNLMFPFLLNFTLPLAALVMVWRSLDRSDVRGDITASVWLAVALASSGLGLLVLAAVGVELVLTRSGVRRWAIMAPGPVLWALWYLEHRESNPLTTDVGRLTSYAGQMLLGGLRSLFADWGPGAWVVAAVLVALMAMAIRRAGWCQPRLWAAVTVPTVFIVLTSTTRADTIPAIPPDELRYAWTIGLGLLLVGVIAGGAAFGSARVTSPEDPQGGAALVASGGTRSPVDGATLRPVLLGAAVVWAVVISFGGVRLWDSMQQWAEMVESSSPGIRSSLYATEVVGPDRIDPDQILPLSFVPVTAGDYLDIVAAVGSPMVGTTAQQLGGDELVRETADRRLVAELPIGWAPFDPPGGDTPCAAPVDLDALQPGSKVLLRPSGAAVGSMVSIARLSDRAGVPLGEIARDGSLLDVPRDAPGAGPSLAAYRVTVAEGVTALSCPRG